MHISPNTPAITSHGYAEKTQLAASPVAARDHLRARVAPLEEVHHTVEDRSVPASVRSLRAAHAKVAGQHA